MLKFTRSGENACEKNGGSGGARTRNFSNTGGGEIESPSQIASQKTFPADLQRVVDSWETLPEPLKAAVLAIVNSSAGKELSR